MNTQLYLSVVIFLLVSAIVILALRQNVVRISNNYYYEVILRDPKNFENILVWSRVDYGLPRNKEVQIFHKSVIPLNNKSIRTMTDFYKKKGFFVEIIQRDIQPAFFHNSTVYRSHGLRRR